MATVLSFGQQQAQALWPLRRDCVISDEAHGAKLCIWCKIVCPG